MIAVDPTEATAVSRLPSLPSAIVVPGLEAMTGADLMLSALDAPAGTETLLRTHARAGALFVQRKSGEDLVHSLGDRLIDSQARMHEMITRPCQRVLLVTGRFESGGDGVAVVNGRETGMKYWSVLAGLARWNDRGGVVEQLIDDASIPAWVDMRLRHLAEYATPAGELRLVYPPDDYPLDAPAPNDPLQLPIRVRDGRVVLNQLKGIGPKLAETIWAYCERNLGWALTLLTDPASPKIWKIPGIGPTTIHNIRQQFGLHDGQRLVIISDDNVTVLEKLEQLNATGDTNHAVQTSH